MAAKLFPPTIESKLPAQFGDTIRIPFLHNRSVGKNEYDCMVLKIKTISTNKEICVLYSTEESDEIFPLKEYSKDDSGNVIETEIALTVGQYYKAQLAYIKNGKSENIYYSTVGIFKYTGEPKVKISINGVDLEAAKNNIIGSQITGHYSNPDDKSEKVYSYCFNIYKDDELLTTSGEMLHSSEKDSSDSSIDMYFFNYVLNSSSVYKIEYGVKTVNGLEVYTPKYRFNKEIEVPRRYDMKVIADPDRENGCVNIKMSYSGLIEGRFRLMRRNSDRQEILKEFTINDIANGEYNLGTDYTIQQGMTYIYGIQQFNDSLTTEIMEADPIYIDFEDAFLFDGKRQLKIKFNPKVSSFKNTVLESKLDTIGGRYPFVFRNGRTKYKEFPISGLISYWMDNDELFMSSPMEPTTNLTGDNIAAERQFKLEVLEWLNNGQPKLFRSPTEGNYIVRLMNVSLSPDDTLGRMLHTFNCTAYEIAECNYEGLKSNGFIGQKVDDFNKLWRFFSQDLDKQESYDLEFSALWARLYGSVGTEYILNFASNKTQTIQIGNTGMYELSCPDDFLTSIKLIKAKNSMKEYGYSYKIEYASTQVDLNSIMYNNQKVKSISIQEYGASFENTSIENMEIISKLIMSSDDGKILSLDNILFLRLEYIGTIEGYEAITDENVSFTFPETNQTILFNIGRSAGVKISDEISKSIIAGRLELTSADFGGKFVLSNLTIGPNIRVDIYYKVKEIGVSQ